ncbi:amidohydrolase [Leucobacter chromiireducens]|nr:amidohydrolase [Leucobacter chromiireducens]
MQHDEPTLYRASTVLTPGPARDTAFAVAGGRFLATGELSELRERYAQARVVDLGNGTVIPGLNDAHAHFADTVQGRTELDVSPPNAPDRDALLRAVRARAARGSGWVIAAGYDDSLTGPISRDELDATCAGSPVLIRHVSAHWAVMNTAALRALDIAEDEPDPAGGSYGRDDTGRLTGHVYERALLGRYVATAGERMRPIPAATPDVLAQAYDETLTQWNSLGITSTCDAFVGPQQLGMHTAAHQRGERRLRVGTLIAAERYHDFRALGLGTGFGDEWLRVVGVKAFVDGAVGGRTCLVSEPFCGTHDHGMEFSSPGALRDLVHTVHRDGNRLAIHANGDIAIRRLLDAYEEAQRAYPSAVRHRIEHCSIVDPEIIARIAELGVIVTPFARYANFYGSRLEQWYGRERTERMFAHRALLDAGVTVAASTDHPASPLSPFAALQSMVTRKGDDGVAVGPSQRISVAEALSVYTVGSAAATGEAHLKGRITPGHLADFVVLDRNPLDVPVDELHSLRVSRTYVGGVRVSADATVG